MSEIINYVAKEKVLFYFFQKDFVILDSNMCLDYTVLKIELNLEKKCSGGFEATGSSESPF